MEKCFFNIKFPSKFLYSLLISTFVLDSYMSKDSHH